MGASGVVGGTTVLNVTTLGEWNPIDLCVFGCMCLLLLHMKCFASTFVIDHFTLLMYVYYNIEMMYY